MGRLVCCLVLLGTLCTFVTSQSFGDYAQLGKPCDPVKKTPKCFPGSACNPTTKICDCADSPDGQSKRTFENKECRLLPGSRCLSVDQDYYRCVQNSECKITRQGEDRSKCPADAPCDIGDAECTCKPGATCLTQKVTATPL